MGKTDEQIVDFPAALFRKITISRGSLGPTDSRGNDLSIYSMVNIILPGKCRFRDSPDQNFHFGKTRNKARLEHAVL